LFELSVGLGVLVALIRRADLAALATLRFRGLWFCFVAVALKVALFSLGLHGAGPVVRYGSGLQLALTATLLCLVVANLHLPGMRLVLAGLVCNLLVIALNGGRMPVTRPALHASGQSAIIPVLVANEVPGHRLADAGTRLALLGDWIPLAALNHRVVSPGDVVVAAGLMITVGYAPPSRQRRRPVAGVGSSSAG
jgi:hypothetical protein